LVEVAGCGTIPNFLSTVLTGGIHLSTLVAFQNEPMSIMVEIEPLSTDVLQREDCLASSSYHSVAATENSISSSQVEEGSSESAFIQANSGEIHSSVATNTATRDNGHLSVSRHVGGVCSFA
jgi:hypothetical protein